MRLSTQAVLASSRRYLDLIGGKQMSESEMHAFIGETVDSYEKHVNRGFITYRKSVTEAGQFAALEWAGHGSTVADLLGREYIDCLGGYGIFSAGINHPRIVKAVTDQMRRMALNSQELLEPWRAALAKLIADITPGDLGCSFFINNGTDAIEGAIKVARLYTKRNTFLSTLGGFHGKSMGSLSLMGKASFREPFGGGLQDVRFAPYGDAAALENELAKAEAVGTPIAAFMVEPIQGEAGAIEPPGDYLPKARELCTRYGALLIADEIQTGMGRTGKLWGVDHWDVAPDIICSAKALGGGVMPIGAFMSTPKIWSVMNSNPFIHTSTTGGNPLACAAAIAAINVTLEEKVSEQAAEKGAYFIAQLKDIAARHRDVYTNITGKGLLIGQHFVNDEVGYAVASGLFKRGVLISGTLNNSRVVRVEPPVVITREEIDTILNRLEDTLRELRASLSTPDVRDEWDTASVLPSVPTPGALHLVSNDDSSAAVA